MTHGGPGGLVHQEPPNALAPQSLERLPVCIGILQFRGRSPHALGDSVLRISGS
jgi:hypothetical protein